MTPQTSCCGAVASRQPHHTDVHGYGAHSDYTGKVFHLIQKLPKAELHIHIEGTLEPEMMFELAARNGVKLPYVNVEEARLAYDFVSLQSFLDLYYAGCTVLRTEQDFHDLTYAYLHKVASQNAAHVEIMFDPQTHLANKVPFSTFIGGIKRALSEAEDEMGISSSLVMCFLRHLSAEDAVKTLREALPYKDDIVAVGLDSSELGNPPSKFEEVFKLALEEGGWPCVAHAGEEGPASYIWDCLNLLKVKRIDHGVHCLDDSKLMAHLAELQIPLTVCPLSNLKLKVYEGELTQKLKQLFESSICITLNSDDPAYFGGYLRQNFEWCTETVGLDGSKVAELCKNSFRASFLPDVVKEHYYDTIDEHLAAFQAHMDDMTAIAD